LPRPLDNLTVFALIASLDIDGHAVCFQPSLRDGVVLRCRFPWTEVHGYPRPSLRDFDPRKLNPTLSASRRPAQRKLLRVSAPLREKTAVWIGVCVPFASLATFALIGSEDSVARLPRAVDHVRGLAQGLAGLDHRPERRPLRQAWHVAPLRACGGTGQRPMPRGDKAHTASIAVKIRNFHSMENFSPSFPRHGKSCPRRGKFFPHRGSSGFSTGGNGRARKQTGKGADALSVFPLRGSGCGAARATWGRGGHRGNRGRVRPRLGCRATCAGSWTRLRRRSLRCA
jgi:hypothetical protein